MDNKQMQEINQMQGIKKELQDHFKDISIEKIEVFLETQQISANASIYEQFSAFIGKKDGDGIIAEANSEPADAPNTVTETLTDGLDAVVDKLARSNQEIEQVETQTMAEIKASKDEVDDKAMRIEEALLKSSKTLLPNGKVSCQYEFELTNEYLNFDNIQEFQISGLEELGLKLNDRIISGKPTSDGTFSLIVECKLNGWSEGKPIIQKQLSLLINPDPRSLWNNIPTPNDLPYFKPDSDLGFISVPDSKNVIVASQRGRSHAHEGIPRDDDFSISYNEESGWYILAVADGAGSAKYSRKGSQIACDTVQAICSSQLTQIGNDLSDAITTYSENTEDISLRKKVGDALYLILGTAAFKSNKKVEKEATTAENKIRDYSTTLVLSIVKKFSFGWFIGSFWVGDGGIGVYRNEDSYLRVLGEPDGGEYAGQTRFLTMNEIITPEGLYKRLRFEIVNDFTSLMLMTDGVSDPMFETDANLMNPDKWETLWADIESQVDLDDPEQASQQLLKWLDFWSAGNHDDRTIAILY